jgi:hypothetical protein
MTSNPYNPLTFRLISTKTMILYHPSLVSKRIKVIAA